MFNPRQLFENIYKKNQLHGITTKPKNPFNPPGKRGNSVAILGGAFGDEGKGRITDEITDHFLRRHKAVINYRDNGGANAGHTVIVDNTKLALHQIGSAILQPNATLISGKGMVIHPEDYVSELNEVKSAVGKIPATLLIDDMAALALDTHRAFEYALKLRATGGRGSTGRGISPAYADIIYRHPLRVRDLASRNWKTLFTDHYRLYQDLLKGLGHKLSQIEVIRLKKSPVKVGSVNTFLNRLQQTRPLLKPHISDVREFLQSHWNSSTPFVFEKAQALGIDIRWGVYPDVTASDCDFTGVHSSTEGIVNPNQISTKVAVIKATYSSSVGQRRMPSAMKGKLAQKIRDDAHEYGTTTGRPRDIHHLDLPLLTYLQNVSGYDYIAPTHLDTAYPNVPIKICISYTKNGKQVPYRPDQRYLETVKPIWIELPSWNGKAIQSAKNPKDLPKPALQYLSFLKQSLGVNILMTTTGPKRHQTIKWY